MRRRCGSGAQPELAACEEELVIEYWRFSNRPRAFSLCSGEMINRSRRYGNDIGRVGILPFEDDAVLKVRYVSTAGLRRERTFVRQASHMYLGVRSGALSEEVAMAVVRVLSEVREGLIRARDASAITELRLERDVTN